MIDPNKAIDYMAKHAKEFAEAKAERRYLEEFRKSKKAILFREAPEGTVQSKEAYAYSHEEYQQLLKGLREAVNIEEKLRYELEAAKLRVEVWRTQSANERFTENL